MKLKPVLLSSACLVMAACSGGSSTAGGGAGGGTADLTAPTVSFSPTTLTVEGLSTGASTLAASDNVGVTSGPSAICTNGGTFASNTFTAPYVDVQTTSVCTGTARDAAGNQGTASLTVTITPGPDTEAPSVSFEPPTLTVASGATGTSTITALDNRAAPTIAVTCTNGGSFDTSTFTAPDVTTDTTSICTATATDAAGNSETAELTVTITPPDTTSPTASFSPTTVALNSAQTATMTLTSADNVGVTSIDVVCDNGGSWASNVYTAPTTETDVTDTCNATVSDAAGNEATASFVATVTGVVAPTTVKISGNVTFDLVPLNTSTSGLNYAATTQSPVRGVTVQAVNSGGTVLESTVSDGSGDYTLEVDLNTTVRIRALAEMVSSSGAQWDVKVIDNTNSDGLYSMQGSLTDSGTVDSVRDLNAASGWGGSSYTGTRVAGPFAILNPIYDALQKVAAADSDANLPAVSFNWSIRNTSTSSGNLATGAIGTSFYSNGKIYILGDDDVDTDEYDDHVVVHEWGHYFEDNMSRSDSIGGQHGGGDRLDPRVAFGEGFGNALSGIMTDDPFYRDSNGAGQASGFSINVEGNTNNPAGWYNEGSVQSILYDIYDSAADGPDNIAAGFAPIYNTLISDSYKSASVFTTIFLFADQYKTLNSGDSAGVDALLSGQSISGTGAEGTGETNSGSLVNSLPVYKEVTSGGGALNICSRNDAGTINKLGIRNFIKFTPSATGSHTLSMVKTSGGTSDPDFVIYNAGSRTAAADSGAANSESWTGTLQAGVSYVIDAYEFNNIDGTSGDFCFNFTASN